MKKGGQKNEFAVIFLMEFRCGRIHKEKRERTLGFHIMSFFCLNTILPIRLDKGCSSRPLRKKNKDLQSQGMK